MRKFIFNVHLYVGLIVGIVVFILGVTGSILAFEPEIDRLLHAKLVYVSPGERLLSLAEIKASVLSQFPDERVIAYGIATSPDRSYLMVLRDHTLNVNPYTGEVLGPNQGRPKFMEAAQELHTTLLLKFGSAIVRWSNVALLFLLVSGPYLWWQYKRVRIRWRGSSIRFWLDVHNSVGILSFVVLLVLSASGVMLSWQARTGHLVDKLSGSVGTDQPDFLLTPPVDSARLAKAVTPDQALEIARVAASGFMPYEINVPGRRRPYTVHMLNPRNLTSDESNVVIVDQYTGKVLFAGNSDTSSAGDRTVKLGRAIHTGVIFGIPSKIVMSLASLMAPVMTTSGVLMWWKKRKTAGGKSSGTS